jgi:uncharacterized protein
MTEEVSAATQRRYILGKQGLWPGRRWSGQDGTACALRAIEAVQVDPVALVAQSHDIALWGRVLEYKPEYLDHHLYEKRRFFEYGGALFIYPMDELPCWRVLMARRKSEKRWASFAQANSALLDLVRHEIRVRGPLTSRDIAGQSVNNYRAGKDTGVALYYLWLTGELMIHSRHTRERVYDFLENVAPLHLQHSASEAEAVGFFARKAVSHRGFVDERDYRSILKALWERPVNIKETREQLAEMVEMGKLGKVRLDSQDLYFLASDTSVLGALSEERVPSEWYAIEKTTTDEVTFLSPLEYVSARGRAKELFGFEHIWEIYKPASKRQFGPYTMPILFGDQLVARMDAKLERQMGILVVNGFWSEEWFAPDDAFALAFAKGLLRLAEFLDATRVDTTALVSQFLREKVDEYLAS